MTPPSVRAAGAEVAPEDLAASDLFAGLPAEQLAECARRASLVGFRRGDLLARQGDRDDFLLVLVSGSVEVVISRAGRSEEFVRVLGRGDIVGDLALLLEQSRTATVRALRDCTAARLTAEDFTWLLDTAPTFGARLARTIAVRLETTTHRVVSDRPVGSVAVVALEPAVEAEASRIRTILEATLPVAAGADREPIELLAQQGHGAGPAEGRLGDEDRMLVRQADVVLGVGRTPTQGALARLRELAGIAAAAQPTTRLELALLQQGAGPYHGTAPWLADRRVGDWHHVSGATFELDVARVARRLSGTAIGLVLSGGGARGFAHIGVLRALREAGITVDVVGGASMGAVVAAQHAAGMAPEEMVERMRVTYQRERGLPDFTLPFVALRTGASTERRLTAMFGEVRIEDLGTTFVCVSSNLVTAESVVHDRGRVWVAVRASTTVPGILPPVRFRNALLVDGGLLENLPVTTVRRRHAGRIIASDVSVRVNLHGRRPAGRGGRWARLLGRKEGLPRIDSILMRTVELASVRDSREAGQPADLYLAPRVDDVAMNHFARLDEVVERGYEHARKELRGWTR